MVSISKRNALYRVCDVLAMAGVGFLFFAVAFESDVRTVYYIAQVVPLLAWFIRILLQSTGRQWEKTLRHYLIFLIISIILAKVAGKRPFDEIMRIFFWEVGVLTFFVLFIINRDYPFRPDIARTKIKRAFDMGLAVYGAAVLLSCFLSFFPDDSFTQVRKGFVAYLLIYLCLSDNFRSFEKFKLLVLAAYTAVICVSLTVLAQGIAYPMGSYAVQNWLVRKEAVRLFAPGTLNPLYHVQFPFDHYYKTAFFLAAGLQIVMLQYFITVRRIPRRWVAATAVLTFAALLFTLSRSGLITAFICLLIVVFMTRRKYIFTVLIILGFFALLTPKLVRQYYGEIARADSYSVTGTKTSMRLERWAVIGEIVLRHPVFGTGYGWKQFGNIYRTVRPGQRLESRPHPYSWYLQVAHESGLVGLFSLLAFSGFLFALLYQGWRQQPKISYYRGINAALISLFLTPYIFGFINSISIGSSALLTWLIYGICASYIKLTVKPRDMRELRRELDVPDKDWEDPDEHSRIANA